MKKKVAILLHGLGANGIDTLFANLSQKWNMDSFDITYLLAVDEGAKQFWEDEVISNGVTVVHITDLDGKKLIKWPVILYKSLKKYGPFDTIHVNMDMLNGINLFVAKLAGIKNRICHAHVSNNKMANGSVKRILKKAYISIMRYLIKKYSCERIACSDLAGEYFYGDMNYSIIYNGIDIDKYKRKNGNKDKSKIKFCTVGRMNEQKNPFFLVDIVAEIISRNSSCTMYWIGAGECEEKIKTLVIKKGIQDRIEFLGIRNDVNVILKECDYFLMPSKYEGLSLALAEAQAAGLDCFVSDTVSKLSDCGKCIFIPLNKNADEWAKIICEHIDSEVVKTLDEKLIEKFDIRYLARTLEDIYNK